MYHCASCNSIVFVINKNGKLTGDCVECDSSEVVFKERPVSKDSVSFDEFIKREKAKQCKK